MLLALQRVAVDGACAKEKKTFSEGSKTLAVLYGKGGGRGLYQPWGVSSIQGGGGAWLEGGDGRGGSRTWVSKGGTFASETYQAGSLLGLGYEGAPSHTPRGSVFSQNKLRTITNCEKRDKTGVAPLQFCLPGEKPN